VETIFKISMAFLIRCFQFQVALKKNRIPKYECVFIDLYGPVCVNTSIYGSFGSFLPLSILKTTCLSLPHSAPETCRI
jgi:hypothetical protein